MPVGFHIASAWVDIRAEDRGLRSDVRRAVNNAARGQEIRVPIRLNSSGLRRELSRAVRMAQRGQVANVGTRINSRGLRRQLSRAVNVAERGQVANVNARIDSRGLRRELNRAVRAATAGQGIRIPVNINSAQLRRQLTRAIRVAQAGQSIRIPVHADTRGLRREVSRAVAAAGAGHRIVIPVRANTRHIRTTGARDINNFSRTGRRAMRQLEWGGDQATNSIMGISRIGLRSMVSTFPGAVAVAVGGLHAIGAAANVTAAVLGAALPVAFIGLGTVALWQTRRVQTAFQRMSHHVATSIRRAAMPMQGALVRGMRLVSHHVRAMEGQLRQAFRATAPLIRPLVNGVMGLVRQALPGLTRALQRSKPIMDGFGFALRKIGKGIGEMFDEMTKNGGAAAIGRIWRILGEGIRMVLKELGIMMRELAKDKDTVDLLRQGFQLLVGVIRITTWAIKGLSKISSWIRNPLKGIHEILQFIFNIGQKITGSAIVIRVRDLASKAARAVWNLLKKIGGHVARAAIWVKDLASKTARGAFNLLKKIGGFVARAVIRLKDLASKIASKIWGWLKKIGGHVARAAVRLKDLASSIAKRIWGWLKKIGGHVARASARLRDLASSIAKRIWGWLKKIGGHVARASARLKDGVTWVAKRAWGWLKKIGGHVARAAARLKDGVTWVAKRAWGWLKKIGGHVARATIRAIDRATAIAKRIHGWLKKIVSKTITIGIDVAKGAMGKLGDLLGFAKGGIVRFADGGNVTGPGTGTSDSILAAVSNGEFVMRAAAVEKLGVPFMNSLNQGKLSPVDILQGMLKGQIPGFATGGAVSAGGSGGGSSRLASGVSGGTTAPTAPISPKVTPTRNGGAQASVSATDDTEPAIVSAAQRFASFKDVVDQTYAQINRSSILFGTQQKLLMTQMGTVQKLSWSNGLRSMSTASTQSYNTISRATQQFGMRQQQRLMTTSGQSLKVWNAWRTGMQSRTAQTMENMRKRVATGGMQVENRFRGARSQTHKVWTNWRTGMQGRTSQAMENMRKRVTVGGNQIENRFRGVRSQSHKIWTNWRTGMQGRTSTAMENMRKRVVKGGNQIEGKFRGSRSTTHKIWTNWRTGMQGRTNSAMDNMRKRVTKGGNQIESRFRGSRSTTHKIWTNWRTGMQGRTDSAMDNMRKRVVKGGNQIEGRFRNARSGTHKVWTNWKNGMQSRTNSAMNNMAKRTQRFRNQVPGTFKSAANNVGKAWNNVRPKLAAPIKYLTGKVINKGVVPAMNSVVSQLGGKAKLKKVSTGGFARGGYVSGPGGPTSDSIPARLSDGEFVIKASSVKKYGVSRLQALNAGRIPMGRVPAFKTGGPVGSAMDAGRAVAQFAGGGLAAVKDKKKKMEDILGEYKPEDYDQLADWVWEHAIDPLLAKAPGGPAMKTVQRRASAVMKASADDYFEANILPPMMANGFVPFRAWRAGDGQRVNWRGVTLNRRTRDQMNLAQKKTKHHINPTQGSYSTRVAASGSTHAGGGAIDLGPAKDDVVGAMRAAGIAAWKRTASEGPWAPHIHGISVGDPTASPAAKAQVRQFFNGLNGLGKPDTFMGGMGGGAGRWRGVVMQVLKATKSAAHYASNVLNQIKRESGGNPRAVNRTDINWKRGHPSVGLMQVIRPTFNAHAGKYRNVGPKMYGVSINPFANIYAGVRYTKSRYGSLGHLRGQPYATGGFVSGPGGPKSDSIPARLSDGEFVMQASAVRKYGVGFMKQINGGHGVGHFCDGGHAHMAGGGLVGMCQGYASGGSVGSTSGSGKTYKIKKGDTLSEIAQKFNTTVAKLVSLNNIQNKHLIYAGKMLKITADSAVDTFVYTIKWGDTLSEIAEKHGTTVAELMRLNSYIKNADKIYAGKTIKIPGSGGGSTPGGPTQPPPPFDQLPPYVFPAFGKIADGEWTDAETKKALKDMVTVSWTESLAGVQSQVITGLTEAESAVDLTKNISDLRGVIDAALKGDNTDPQQKKMIDRVVLATKELVKWQTQLDEGAAAFEAATAKVEELQGSFDSLKDSTMDSIKSFAAITKIGTWGTNVNVLTGQLQADIAKAEDFANSLEALKARGVNSDMLGQIVEAGITGGGLATAHTLLRATPEELARLNALQEQLNAVAERTGTAAAEGMYGAGLQAAKGLLAGMEAERKQIEAYMMKIAVAMEKSIKEALGIKSPSRVFMKVGEMATLGMVHGLGSRVSDVVTASQNVGNAATSGAVTASRPVTSGARVAGGGGNTYNISVNVDGNWDLSNPGERRKVASLLVREIKEEIRKDDRRRR